MLVLPDQSGAYVYILECSDHTYYTGWTTNLKERYQAHLSGKGAKYTRAHKPLACVYFEIHKDKQSAMKREYEIKQLSRKEKLILIENKQEHDSCK